MGMKPMVGQNVHYWPDARRDPSDRDPMPGSKQPYAAQIVFIHEDDTVNLLIWNHYGSRFVSLRVEHGFEGKAGTWSWLPR